MSSGRKQNILIAGSSGTIGRALRQELTHHGYHVLSLVRREPRSPDEFRWDPAGGQGDPRAIDAADAVVDLAGSSIAQLPWTARSRRSILESRLEATRMLARMVEAATDRPDVVLNASAVGFYGDRPGEILTETSAKGTGFLSDVVAEWEAAAAPIADVTRLAFIRTGIVLAPAGSLAPIAALTRLGLGTRLGSGKAVWPWISLRDEVAAIRFLIQHEIRGPVNLAAPEPATSHEITREVARVLHRPYLLKAPEFALRLLLRDAADDLLLSSQRVSPGVLLRNGFEFRDLSLRSALVDALSGSPRETLVPQT